MPLDRSTTRRFSIGDPFSLFSGSEHSESEPLEHTFELGVEVLRKYYDREESRRQSRLEFNSRLSLKPVATHVIYAKRWFDVPWDEISGQAIKLTVNCEQRMQLKWEKVAGILTAGNCDLLQFPKAEDAAYYSNDGEELSTLSKEVLAHLLEEVVRDQYYGDQIEQLRDVSGAGIIHCLMLANNDDSLSLAMRLIHARPSLLHCVHKKGRGNLQGVFDGEGALHILAVNKQEKLFHDLIKLVHEEGEEEDLKDLLMQRCAGKFFSENVPMFGATPLSYAAYFGFKSVFETIFGKRLEDGTYPPGGEPLLDEESRNLVVNGTYSIQPVLNSNADTFGYYPIHAVVACGDTDMYDILVDKCDANDLGFRADCPKTKDMDLTPLQLAAWLGKKKMFRHILRKRTKPVWKWGPEAEYQIPLDEIDSADSKGSMTVMELLVHPNASKAAQEFLLPDFLNNFLYDQYVEKWKLQVRYLYFAYLVALLAYVVLVTLIAAPSISALGWRSTQENVRGFLIADLGQKPVAVGIAIFVTSFFALVEILEFFFTLQKGDDNIERSKEKLMLAWRMCRYRGGHLLLVSTVCSLIGLSAILIEGPENARLHGWTRGCLSIGSSVSWLSLLSLLCVPHQEKSTYISVVFDTLLTDVKQFLVLFIPLLISFSTGINALMQPFPPWVTRWASWWQTFENLLLLSITSEPPEIYQEEGHPSSVVYLFGTYDVHGTDSLVLTALFYLLFVLFLIVNVVLLLNLLIAMMSARYDKKKRDAERDSRVEFGRLVLRFETLLESVYERKAKVFRPFMTSAPPRKSIPTTLGTPASSMATSMSFETNARASRGASADHNDPTRLRADTSDRNSCTHPSGAIDRGRASTSTRPGLPRALSGDFQSVEISSSQPKRFGRRRSWSTNANAGDGDKKEMRYKAFRVESKKGGGVRALDGKSEHKLANIFEDEEDSVPQTTQEQLLGMSEKLERLDKAIQGLIRASTGQTNENATSQGEEDMAPARAVSQPLRSTQQLEPRTRFFVSYDEWPKPHLAPFRWPFVSHDEMVVPSRRRASTAVGRLSRRSSRSSNRVSFADGLASRPSLAGPPRTADFTTDLIRRASDEGILMTIPAELSSRVSGDL